MIHMIQPARQSLLLKLLDSASVDNAFAVLCSHFELQLKWRPESSIRFWIEGWDIGHAPPGLAELEQEIRTRLATTFKAHFHMQFLIQDRVESWRVTIELTQIPHIEFVLDFGAQVPEGVIANLVNDNAIDVFIDGRSGSYYGRAVAVYLLLKISQKPKLLRKFNKIKGAGSSPIKELSNSLAHEFTTEAKRIVSSPSNQEGARRLVGFWDSCLSRLAAKQGAVCESFALLELTFDEWSQD